MLLATAFALTAAGIALLVTDLRASRAASARDLAIEANYLALSLQGYLAFNDAEGAQHILQALQARPSVSVAALYDARGVLIAKYPANSDGAPDVMKPADVQSAVTVHGDVIDLQKPVLQGSELLGTIFVRSRHDEAERVRSYLAVLAGVMALGLLVTFAAAAWLRKIVTRPLDSISHTARQVIERNDFTVRAEKTTADEIGVVVDAFNKMLDEVQARAHSLMETDRRKDEFLATLAHELRNPLAPIRNAVRIFTSKAANESQREWGVEIIGRQVSRMALLLDDLLDVSRITRGKLELKKDYVDLKSLLSVALETARPLVDAKHHDVTVHLPDERIELQVDPLRLSQVIGNLLTNAAKYTDPHGSIELSAAADSSGLIISVKDNGIGLNPADIPRLFTIFAQVDSNADRAEGGLGIGLALAKGLVELHGGTIEAKSAGLGCGSEFRVYLPPVVFANSGRSNDPALVSLPSSANRCKVLVVDDNKDAAESLAMVLRLGGYDVCMAFTGEAALATGAREKPDALLLDIGMPGMSGYEVARRIRNEAWGRAAALIAITGWGQHHDKQAAKAAGFDEHLTKPVDPAAVEAALSELTRARASATAIRSGMRTRASEGP